MTGSSQVSNRREQQFLGRDPIGRLIFRFAIPSIISMMVNAAYNITDQIFIGQQVGMLGNAATNIAFPMTTLTIALSLLMGIGTAANLNISIGAQRPEEGIRYVGTGLTLTAILSVCHLLVLVLFQEPLLYLCGVTSEILPYARDYFSLTALGLPLLLFSNASSNIIRADGSPTYSMFCVVTGALVNVVLDALFMLVFHWGIRGAAAATLIGQALSFFLCVIYFPRFRSVKLSGRAFGIRLRYALSIVQTGLSGGINLGVMMLVNIVMNRTLSHYGALSPFGREIPLAVSGVIAKLNSILSAFSVGLAQGCQPIWGYNYGAGKIHRVKETYLKAASVALGVSMSAFFLFQLFPRQIVSIFGGGEENYFIFAERYMRIFMALVGVFGVQPLSVTFFSATENIRQGVFLSITKQGLVLLPLLLLLPRRMGLDGVLIAGPVSDCIAFLLSVSLVLFSFRRMADRADARAAKKGDGDERHL
ncbi:MAG: MATE family efflux transporter [Ndongobacter sp.]|nr:MATE family efflux transporter [Ndongobacter sp.]